MVFEASGWTLIALSSSCSATITRQVIFPASTSARCCVTCRCLPLADLCVQYPPAGTKSNCCTRWRSSRGTAAPQEDQSGSAADWRPPKSGDQAWLPDEEQATHRRKRQQGRTRTTPKRRGVQVSDQEPHAQHARPRHPPPGARERFTNAGPSIAPLLPPPPLPPPPLPIPEPVKHADTDTADPRHPTQIKQSTVSPYGRVLVSKPCSSQHVVRSVLAPLLALVGCKGNARPRPLRPCPGTCRHDTERTRKSTIQRRGQFSVSRSFLLRFSTQIVYGLSSGCRGNLAPFGHMGSCTSRRRCSLHVVVATWPRRSSHVSLGCILPPGPPLRRPQVRSSLSGSFGGYSRG